MTDAVNDSLWFALAVRSRHEKVVSSVLREKGYTEFLPLYKSRHRHAGGLRWVDLPLFPTYTFCQFDPARRLPILMTPGVLSIVGMGKTPVPVENHEVQAIRAAARSGLEVKPWPFLRTGDRVLIEDGPMRGIEGFLVRDDCKDRVVVSVNLLQRSIAAEVDRSWIRPVSTASNGRP